MNVGDMPRPDRAESRHQVQDLAQITPICVESRLVVQESRTPGVGSVACIHSMQVRSPDGPL
jgi:hypothetical protein